LQEVVCRNINLPTQIFITILAKSLIGETGDGADMDDNVQTQKTKVEAQKQNNCWK
jgi:hypothetical protein